MLAGLEQRLCDVLPNSSTALVGVRPEYRRGISTLTYSDDSYILDVVFVASRLAACVFLGHASLLKGYLCTKLGGSGFGVTWLIMREGMRQMVYTSFHGEDNWLYTFPAERMDSEPCLNGMALIRCAYCRCGHKAGSGRRHEARRARELKSYKSLDYRCLSPRSAICCGRI